ncbi:MAG TPA: sugar ABC transporter permease [Chloroflexota bacterium]|nr:sugar ABC transporter permease [Chloroflexota bacterium]
MVSGHQEQRRFRLTYRTRQQTWGVLFVLPVVLLFVVFRLYPMLSAIVLSFESYDLISKPRWVGLANYQFLFSNDQVLTSFRVTVEFVIFETIPLVVLALTLAFALYALPRLRHLFEAIYYYPVVMTAVVAALIWLTLYYPRGFMDQLVAPFFPLGVPWLTNATLALPSVIVVDIWKSIGYYMIILLAGLLAIPVEYVEAAKIDGASGLQWMHRIVMPLLKPQLLFVVAIALINTVQAFDTFYVMTRGGPADATRVLPIEIYLRGFQLLQMGRAAAVSLVMFVFLMIMSLIQLRIFGTEGY